MDITNLHAATYRDSSRSHQRTVPVMRSVALRLLLQPEETRLGRDVCRWSGRQNPYPRAHGGSGGVTLPVPVSEFASYIRHGINVIDTLVWVKPGGELDWTSSSSAVRYGGLVGKIRCIYVVPRNWNPTRGLPRGSPCWFTTHRPRSPIVTPSHAVICNVVS